MNNKDSRLMLVQGPPSGMKPCPVCGEYKGSIYAQELDWSGAALPPEPYTIITASCVCDGIPCPKCKKNKIHRPGSNSYSPRWNSIEHWPYFSGMVPCKECRDKVAGPDNKK
jgi:hypothetical protein